jgi:PIN domain nuclease of toxin-antitoxin system
MYWYIEGDAKLSHAARTLIQDASNDVFISPVSYWEIAIKVSLGKWTLNRTYEEFIDLGLKHYGFLLLPILPTHTVKLMGLAYLPTHKDPFDRLLVAQTLAEGMALVSADPQFDAYGVKRLW